MANSSQYKAQMAGIEKSSQKTNKAITAAFAVSSIAIAGTLKAFAEYETLLIKVGKTADLQGKELKDFGKEVTDMSARIPLSTKKLLDLAASAAQIGVKGKDNILKFTETVAKLGTATDIVGEEGTRAIARLLNITGEGIGTVGRFGAVITKLGNETAATESEILSIASRVGKATAQFDLGTVSVLGISAALKGVGVEAELGGSAIGRTFLEIQNAVFKGGEALDVFAKIAGKTGEELKQIFEKDATEAFKIFIDSLSELPADQVVMAMEAMNLKGVRLREVIGTLAKRSDLLTESLKLASDEARNQTALNEEFERAVNSLSNSWKFLKIEIFNAAKSMGSDLSPAAKESIKDITALIKGIREFNEETGGLITSSVVFAAKLSAITLAVSKLRSILISTGIITATMAANTRTLNGMMGVSATRAGILSASFKGLRTSVVSAGVALKSFQVTLGVMVGGLLLAIEAGKELGKVLADLAPAATSESELVQVQKNLNTQLGIRLRLQKKVAEGDEGAAERLGRLDKEIAKNEMLVKILQREVEKRKQLSEPKEDQAADSGVAGDVGDSTAAAGGDNAAFALGETEKTLIEKQQIELRIAAAQREAELMAGIQKGMTDEAVRIAQDRNAQLGAIDAKKAELEQVNRDLSKGVIEESEREILELKRSAAQEELMILEEKFVLTEEKTAGFEAESMEARIASKQLLNQSLTEQELLFLEEKRVKDEENRAIDVDLKTLQAEEDLLFLQNQLMTETQAKDFARQDQLTKIAKEHNTRIKEELLFGKNIAKTKAFFRSNEVKATTAVLDTIGQIQLKEGSKAFKVQQGFAIANATIKIAESAVNAYAAMAAIPVTGPSLGIAAAATAIATGLPQLAIIASTAASFAVGTDFVPTDMMANIHQGEGIIPAKQNQFLQSGNLVLGSPEALSQNTAPQKEGESSLVVNINFEGANIIGDVGEDDNFIGQIENAIAIGIDEGRFAGFQQATVAVT